MSTPPTSTPWVPLWPKESPKPEIPPAINGRYLRYPPSWEDPGLVVPDTGWHIIGGSGEPQYQNGWGIWPDGNYTPCRFRKTADGLVLLEGLITGGSAGTTAFTLPVGYRPTAQADASGRIGHVLSGTNYPSVPWGTFHIHPGGEVNPSIPSGYWLAIDNIMFYAGPDVISFKPSDLPGLVVHLDGASLALADGATITDWPNLASGGVATAWEGTGKPTVRTTARGNVVKFTASQQTALLSVPSLDRNFTFAYYARMLGPATGRIMSSYHHGGTDALWGFWNGLQDMVYMNGVWGNNAQGNAVDTNWKIHAVQSGSFSTNLYKNSSHTAYLNNPPATVMNGFQINGYNGSGERSDFEIAEFIAYDRRLSNDDRLQLENYLRKKWIN